MFACTCTVGMYVHIYIGIYIIRSIDKEIDRQIDVDLLPPGQFIFVCVNQGPHRFILLPGGSFLGTLRSVFLTLRLPHSVPGQPIVFAPLRTCSLTSPFSSPIIFNCSTLTPPSALLPTPLLHNMQDTWFYSLAAKISFSFVQCTPIRNYSWRYSVLIPKLLLLHLLNHPKLLGIIVSSIPLSCYSI